MPIGGDNMKIMVKFAVTKGEMCATYAPRCPKVFLHNKLQALFYAVFI